MINFTDVNPTLFASDGQFFYGKLVFLSPGTTDPKQVFDKDGVVYASNVVTTDTKGRMAIQVFLDGAYDVQFWKFVGTQFDIDDPTQWALDREVRILDPSKVELKISGDAIVGTIEDLRGVDNAAEGATMTVMGYYAAGDMTPQYYYWNPNAADPDDGGSAICPEGRTGKGRWLMIPQRVVDVRAFGVKPSQQTETATVTGNMAAAFNFANRYNRDLWFPKVYPSTLYSQPAYSYYAFGGGNLLLANNSLLVDNCVQFIPFAGSTKIVVKDIKKNDFFIQDLLDYPGTISITCDTYQTVWGSSFIFSPRKRVVIDAVRANNLNCDGLEIVLRSTGYNGGLRFKNCTFTIEGGFFPKPSNNVYHTFEGCIFTDRLYSNGDETDPLYKWMLKERLVLTNCKVETVNQFDLPVNYVFAILKNGGNTVDLEGKKLVFVGNRYVDDYFEKIATETTFCNMETQASLEKYFSGRLTFSGCRFTAAPLDSGSYSYARFYDCIFDTSTDVLKVQRSNMNNCLVECPVTIPTLIAEGCRFGKQVTVNENSSSSELNSCNFAEKVVVGALNGRVSVYATNNRFAKGLELGQSGQIQIYGCRFIGNYFETGGIKLGSGVTIDQDEEQAYVYDGNRGAVPLNKRTGLIPSNYGLNGLLEWVSNSQFATGGLKLNMNFSFLPDLDLLVFGKRNFRFTLRGTIRYNDSSNSAFIPFVVSAVYSISGSGVVNAKNSDKGFYGVLPTYFDKDNQPNIYTYTQGSPGAGEIFVVYPFSGTAGSGPDWEILDSNKRYRWTVEVEEIL